MNFCVEVFQELFQWLPLIERTKEFPDPLKKKTGNFLNIWSTVWRCRRIVNYVLGLLVCVLCYAWLKVDEILEVKRQSVRTIILYFAAVVQTMDSQICYDIHPVIIPIWTAAVIVQFLFKHRGCVLKIITIIISKIIFNSRVKIYYVIRVLFAPQNILHLIPLYCHVQQVCPDRWREYSIMRENRKYTETYISHKWCIFNIS
jgi:hypothetical protein